MREAIEGEEDEYGNIIGSDRLRYCCFPDCGCDGARLCMAEEGASKAAFGANVEGMYQRGDMKAQKAKMRLLQIVHSKEPVK